MYLCLWALSVIISRKVDNRCTTSPLNKKDTDRYRYFLQRQMHCLITSAIEFSRTLRKNSKIRKFDTALIYISLSNHKEMLESNFHITLRSPPLATAFEKKNFFFKHSTNSTEYIALLDPVILVWKTNQTPLLYPLKLRTGGISTSWLISFCLFRFSLRFRCGYPRYSSWIPWIPSTVQKRKYKKLNYIHPLCFESAKCSFFPSGHSTE